MNMSVHQVYRINFPFFLALNSNQDTEIKTIKNSFDTDLFYNPYM